MTSYTLTASTTTFGYTANAVANYVARILRAANDAPAFEVDAFFGTAFQTNLSHGYGVAAGTTRVLYGHKVRLVTAVFSYTGFSAGVYRGFRIGGDVGVFALAGYGAAVRAARKAAVASGVFAYTGRSIAARAARKFPVSKGAFAYTGGNTRVLRGYLVRTVAGQYAWAGQVANVLWGHVTHAARGVFAITGYALGTRAAYLLTSGAGAFTLTGHPVTVPVWDPSECILIPADDGWAMFALPEDTAMAVEPDGLLSNNEGVVVSYEPRDPTLNSRSAT